MVTPNQIQHLHDRNRLQRLHQQEQKKQEPARVALRERLAQLEEAEGDRIQVVELNPQTLEEIGLPELGDLPADIAIMGGAARAILQRQLFGEDVPVRDIDLLQIADIAMTEADELQRLSQHFMPDDSAYDHGIMPTELDTYFNQRDFTMNEVLVAGGKIIASQQCIDDLGNKIIRPTQFEDDFDYERAGTEYRVGPKLSFKAMVLKSVFKTKYNKGDYAPGFEPDRHGTWGFLYALALNKAAQYNDKMPGVMDAFMNESRYGFTEDPVDIAIELSQETDFQFRDSSLAEQVSRYLEQVEEQAESWRYSDWVDGIALTSLRGRARNLAIAEFDTFV